MIATTYPKRYSSLFDDWFWADPFYQKPKQNMAPMDVIAYDDYVEIQVECAGMKKEDLSIELKEGTLTISGEKNPSYEEAASSKERRYGSFKRELRVKHGLTTEDIEASYEDGVLTVILKKKETPKEETQVSIK